MKELLSRRVNAIQPSPTMAIAARAIALRREGRDVVSLSVGEPDFPIFPHVAEAIAEAIRKGHTKYTPSAGTARSVWSDSRYGLREEINGSVR